MATITDSDSVFCCSIPWLLYSDVWKILDYKKKKNEMCIYF